MNDGFAKFVPYALVAVTCTTITGFVSSSTAPAADPAAPQRMEVITELNIARQTMWILRDRETGEEYLVSYRGGIAHLVKHPTTPKP
jgi:hypothetical protein